MLILSREVGQTICIGEGDKMIEVEVIEIRGGKVRLGTQAPAEVPVHRREVYDLIQLERRSA